LVFAASGLYGATIEGVSLGTEAQENSCGVRRITDTIRSTESEIYVRFQARRVRSGERLRVDWVDPRGQVASSAPYDDLPAAPDLCFVTALPVGGFAPASQPGTWSVRISVNGTEVVAKPFQITGTVDPRGMRIISVDRNGRELTVQGVGFISDSVVHVAQYKAAGGWSYIQSTLATSAVGGVIRVPIPELEPSEYLVIVSNPSEGRETPPARFLVATTNNYRLPLVGGDKAQVTQGPYGPTHYGNSLHAFDIVGDRGACVVAMRGGVVRTYDLGLRRTPTRRIFGNYISIEHEGGEFSHYAHLATRSFKVREGQRVEQGQALATMGNSGYTLGSGGGYHVHVHITRSAGISSGSIPFRFEELPLSPRQSFRGILRSSNNSDGPACEQVKPVSEWQSGSGSVGMAEWWERTVDVAPSTSVLDVKLEWKGSPEALNLVAISPSGRMFGAYGEATGYTGAQGQPEALKLVEPEAGVWRIAVHGVSGGNPVGFQASWNMTLRR